MFAPMNDYAQQASEDFVIPRTRTRTADSAFMVAAPSAWNALPSERRTITSKTVFHNRLKLSFFLAKLPIVNLRLLSTLSLSTVFLTFYMDSTYDL